MTTTSETARFISGLIDESEKTQRQIATEVGLTTPDEISSMQSGAIKLPISMVGPIAKALATDPVQLLTMCLHEYFPETWESVRPFLDSILTDDELSLVRALRSAVGGPYVMSLTPDERKPLNDFIHGLQKPASIH
jgi:hypothetical protein